MHGFISWEINQTLALASVRADGIPLVENVISDHGGGFFGGDSRLCAMSF